MKKIDRLQKIAKKQQKQKNWGFELFWQVNCRSEKSFLAGKVEKMQAGRFLRAEMINDHAKSLIYEQKRAFLM